MKNSKVAEICLKVALGVSFYEYRDTPYIYCYTTIVISEDKVLSIIKMIKRPFR